MGYVQKTILVMMILIQTNLLFSQKKLSKDTLFYKTDSTLRWRDFKGHSIPSAAATADSYISIYANAKPNVKTNSEDLYIYPVFLKKKSWYKSAADTTEYLLKHEQLHFDIAELVCRMIRKELKQEFGNSFDNYQKRYEKILNKYLKQYTKMSEDYDNETSHSLNMAKQKEWNDKIKQMLDDLSEYSAPVVSIDLNKFK